MRKKVISREEIIEGAISIIRNEGIKACSIRGIASALGVAVGTIYNYYESHEMLLNDVFEVSWRRTIQRLENLVADRGTAEEKIIVFCDILFEEIDARKGLGRALYGRLPLLSAGQDEAITKRENIFNSLTELIAKIIKESPRNSTLDEKGLEMVSNWLLLSAFSYKGSGEAYIKESFNREIISRFL